METKCKEKKKDGWDSGTWVCVLVVVVVGVGLMENRVKQKEYSIIFTDDLSVSE